MKHERDLGKLESFRKSLSSSLGSPQKHARELEFMRENGLQQVPQVPQIRDLLTDKGQNKYTMR